MAFSPGLENGMLESQRILVYENFLLCASASAGAALDAAVLPSVSSRLRAMLAGSGLERAVAGTECHGEFSIEGGSTFHLRIRALAASDLDAVRYIAQIDPAIGSGDSQGRELDRINGTAAQLRSVEEKLLQADKMASIGQLAAGIAHEINNPIGYIHSNLGTLGEYVGNLLELMKAYDGLLRDAIPDSDESRVRINEIRQKFDFDFLINDLPMLLSESREGIERVRKIVQDLRDFSRAGYAEDWAMADIHRGLDSTLNIVWNDLKYKCEVRREYGEIPLVECLPSQLNQVFLNILVNAGQAIDAQGTITIVTGRESDTVVIEITDNGKGIAPEDVSRIFDPFFTTKPVGQGTGLGLSLSYNIVRKHGGHIDVRSAPGAGATFRIVLPLRQIDRGGGDDATDSARART
ncbi:MAG TPA: ATP-binding protein [Burkholderiales bacterium]|nr:ATP-binding protein [Burkholderiales bacterium]